MIVPAIAHLLVANYEDVPHIYLYDAKSGYPMMYPEKLDDVNRFTPELILAWAEKSAEEINVANYNASI